MSTNTGIQWTDATWNPVVGCEHVSPGCDNCYAKQLHDMRHKARLAGKRVLPLYDQPFEVVQLRPHKLTEPLRWRHPQRVFVNSMSDLFHKDVPLDFLDKCFVVMAYARRHTFQILTKRPHRMRAYMRAWLNVGEDDALKDRWDVARHWLMEQVKPAQREFVGVIMAHVTPVNLPNVWLGTSTESQAMLDKRLPMLMETPAAVRFLSMEPLLERVEIGIDDIASRDWEGRYLDWVIVGGESGLYARPCHVEWIEEILAECWEFGVPCFVKQLGSLALGWTCASGAECTHPDCGEQPLVLRDRKGGDIEEWPQRLRVRQFPEEAVPA